MHQWVERPSSTSVAYLYEELEMMWMASCTISIRAPLIVGTGGARAMEGASCQKAGTEDLNFGALVSGEQKLNNEGTQNLPCRVESSTGSQAEFGNSQVGGHQVTNRIKVRS